MVDAYYICLKVIKMIWTSTNSNRGPLATTLQFAKRARYQLRYMPVSSQTGCVFATDEGQVAEVG